VAESVIRRHPEPSKDQLRDSTVHDPIELLRNTLEEQFQRSGGAVTTIPAPPKRPAGSGWTAAAVDGRRVRVPGECELVMEKWSLRALADGLLSHAFSASSRRSA
jgi:hypothetical protein